MRISIDIFKCNFRRPILTNQSSDPFLSPLITQAQVKHSKHQPASSLTLHQICDVANGRNMEDLLKAINEDKLDQCLLLDAAQKEEFRGGHIAGASNLPHDSISQIMRRTSNYQKAIVYVAGVKS